MRMGYNFTSSRLVGRSVWNTKWMLVIPATSINAKDQAKGLADFAKNVTDIKIGFKAYSRQGTESNVGMWKYENEKMGR